jgi:quinol monooxygenase YgiN
METIVMTMDVKNLTHREFRAIIDEMGVEKRPEPGIYEHISHATENGYRIIEVWDSQKAFEKFVENRMTPAIKKLGINRETTIKFQFLQNFFGPRMVELPALVSQLPGGPNT